MSIIGLRPERSDSAPLTRSKTTPGIRADHNYVAAKGDICTHVQRRNRIGRHVVGGISAMVLLAEQSESSTLLRYPQVGA